ncbi:MAG: hypothetical protein HQK96_05555, partial [Nitrospirae bacterium]|nr:hypothetical protein [Nitrospirota bacterium]
PIGCKNLVTEEDVPELDLAVVSVDVPKESARFVADYLERRLCPVVCNAAFKTVV